MPCVSSNDGSSILEPKLALSFLGYILNSLVDTSMTGKSSYLALFSIFSLGIGVYEAFLETTCSSPFGNMVSTQLCWFIYFSISGLCVCTWCSFLFYSQLGNYPKGVIRPSEIERKVHLFQQEVSSSLSALLFQINGPTCVLIMNCDFFLAVTK